MKIQSNKNYILLLVSAILILSSSYIVLKEVGNKKNHSKSEKIYQDTHKFVLENNLKDKVLNLNLDLDDSDSLSELLKLLELLEKRIAGKGFCKLYIRNSGGYIKMPNPEIGKTTSSYINIRSLKLEDRKFLNHLINDSSDIFYKTFDWNEETKGTKIFNFLDENKSNDAFIITTILN